MTRSHVICHGRPSGSDDSREEDGDGDDCRGVGGREDGDGDDCRGVGGRENDD